jgi:hypothetical protein
VGDCVAFVDFILGEPRGQDGQDVVGSPTAWVYWGNDPDHGAGRDLASRLLALLLAVHVGSNRCNDDRALDDILIIDLDPEEGEAA